MFATLWPCYEESYAGYIWSLNGVFNGIVETQITKYDFLFFQMVLI